MYVEIEGIEKKKKEGKLPNPIKLVLETYEDVNRIYAIFNNTRILAACEITHILGYYENAPDSKKIREQLKEYVDYKKWRQYHDDIYKELYKK